MIHYPISTLMNAGLREILIITTPQDQASFERLLGDGSEWGLELTYTVPAQARGARPRFHSGTDFLDGDAAALVLGDNIFYGPGLGTRLRQLHDIRGGHVFAYRVANPSAYGVVEFDASGSVGLSLEEKPSKPRSNYAVPGFLLLRSGRR